MEVDSFSVSTKFRVKFSCEHLIRNLKIRFVSKVQPNSMRMKKKNRSTHANAHKYPHFTRRKVPSRWSESNWNSCKYLPSRRELGQCDFISACAFRFERVRSMEKFFTSRTILFSAGNGCAVCTYITWAEWSVTGWSANKIPFWSNTNLLNQQKLLIKEL